MAFFLLKLNVATTAVSMLAAATTLSDRTVETLRTNAATSPNVLLQQQDVAIGPHLSLYQLSWLENTEAIKTIAAIITDAPTIWSQPTNALVERADDTTLPTTLLTTTTTSSTSRRTTRTTTTSSRTTTSRTSSSIRSATATTTPTSRPSTSPSRNLKIGEIVAIVLFGGIFAFVLLCLPAYCFCLTCSSRGSRRREKLHATGHYIGDDGAGGPRSILLSFWRQDRQGTQEGTVMFPMNLRPAQGQAAGQAPPPPQPPRPEEQGPQAPPPIYRNDLPPSASFLPPADSGNVVRPG